MGRIDLHNKLLTIMPNVYYQPPATIKMIYPCIIYLKEARDEKFADDMLYSYRDKYRVTLVNKNPDASININAVLPLASYERRYVADGLYHDVFVVFQ